MTGYEAKALKVNDRVLWDGNPNDAGTVDELSQFAVHIKWDDGQDGWIHYFDMQSVTKA